MEKEVGAEKFLPPAKLNLEETIEMTNGYYRYYLNPAQIKRDYFQPKHERVVAKKAEDAFEPVVKRINLLVQKLQERKVIVDYSCSLI